MIQTNMFDQAGKPTELATRYVRPKYYSVYNSGGSAPTRDARRAIKMWLMHPDSKIKVVW
jgi:hypothetical protein